MGMVTKIEWAHHTFNHVRGCSKVSDGCAGCYAEAMSVRNPAVLGEWGPRGSRVIAAEKYWGLPRRWNNAAAKAGVRRRVFCASLADVFEGRDTMPPASWIAVTAARARLFSVIEQTPWLDWLLLTKRPQHIMAMVPQEWHHHWPTNVWAGTSVEDQKTADARLTHLRTVPARRRFISAEPLLASVNVDLTDIHWLILGGESGAKARPMHPEWARGMRDQAVEACVPFFFKQWGAWHPYDGQSNTLATVQLNGASSRTWTTDVFGDEALMERVGKKKAGRLLDGREWNEFPKQDDHYAAC